MPDTTAAEERYSDDQPRLQYLPNFHQKESKDTGWEEASPHRVNVAGPLGGWARLVLPDTREVEGRAAPLNRRKGASAVSSAWRVRVNGTEHPVAVAPPRGVTESALFSEPFPVRIENPAAGETLVEIVATQDGFGKHAQSFRFGPHPTLALGWELRDTLSDFEKELHGVVSLEEGGDQGVVRWGTLRVAVECGELLLFRQPETVQKDPNRLRLLDALEKAMPHLLAICRQPRTRLLIEEQIRPVGLVRRTGPTALRHIASHSEHWESRTVTGLRPARLLAQVPEDDLALYENRFVIMFIDELREYLVGEANRLLEGMRSLADILQFDGFSSSDWQQNRLLQSLLPNLDHNSEVWERQYQALSEEVERVRRLRRALIPAENSTLYRRLHKLPSLAPPFHTTNILRMDPHYRRLFDVWRLLAELRRKAGDTGDSLPQTAANAQHQYRIYTGLVVLQALAALGYQPVKGEEQTACAAVDHSGWMAQGAYVNSDGHWRIEVGSSRADPGEWEVIDLTLTTRHRMVVKPPSGVSFTAPTSLPELPCEAVWEGSALAIYGQPTPEELDLLARAGKSESWRRFVLEKVRSEARPAVVRRIRLIPLAIALEESGESKGGRWQENVTTDLLDIAYAQAVGTKTDAILWVTPTEPANLPATCSPAVAHRLLSLGDGFIPRDAARWAGARTGFLCLSPWRLQSALRLIRLIRFHTIGVDITSMSAEESGPSSCPACKGAVHYQSATAALCRSCGAEWTVTRCPACQSSYPLLRPRRRLASVRRTVVALPEEDLTYARQLSDRERRRGSMAIPLFCECSADTQLPEGQMMGMVYPICPHCGHCSQSRSTNQQCLRCQDGQ
ncbi:hypothetical protein HNQ39_005734 [Armatimonas rosea]|uniref:DUF2357 domain-containing protein n=1 Tax=Armatimonas rosea TaxID=685828 RepID=A0A7W9SW05_ARMRO|nr:hypothetical protein [Armatimonas rosea]